MHKCLSEPFTSCHRCAWRHFAPYGSYIASCGEPLPVSVGASWNRETGDYVSDRFTTRRAKTSCPECSVKFERNADAEQHTR